MQTRENKAKPRPSHPGDPGRSSQRVPRDRAGPATTLKPTPQPSPWTETKAHHTHVRMAAMVGSHHVTGRPCPVSQVLGDQKWAGI